MGIWFKNSSDDGLRHLGNLGIFEVIRDTRARSMNIQRLSSWLTEASIHRIEIFF